MNSKNQNAELVFEIDVKIFDTISFEGKDKVMIIPFSAKTHGKFFTGETVINGTDTQIRDSQGTLSIAARYILKGKDFTGQDCFIYIENKGSSIDSCIPQIKTDSEALSFLSNEKLFSEIEGKEGGVIIKIFRAQ